MSNIFISGNEWMRIDLHLHTKSDDKFKYKGNNFIKDYIDALEYTKIRIGAITNHNKFDLEEYLKLREEAKKKEIWLLPGVELEIKEGKRGIHVLIIWDGEKIEADNDFITPFINRQFDLQTNAPNKKLEDVLKDLEELKKDYILIFAHVDNEKGFFKEINPANYINWIEKGYFRDKILSLQGINNSSKSVFENEIQKVYKKEWEKYKPAYVSFVDPSSIEDIKNKNKKTYVKIGAFNFSALKFAFLNYKLRVRDNIPTKQYSKIVSLRIDHGDFMEEERFYFNFGLNTLIGIRGSGKSSVIEVLRWIIGKDPLNGSDTDYKNSLIKHALGNSGEATLKIITKDGLIYTIKKGYLDHYPIVFDESGKRINIKNIKGLFDFRYFGQKDLSKIAEETTQQLSLIDGFMENELANLKEKEKEIKNRIKEIFKEISTLELKRIQIEDIEDKLNTLKEKLKIYKDKGIDKFLEEQTNFEKEEEKIKFVLSVINEQDREIRKIRNSVEESFNVILEYNFTFYGDEFKNKLVELKNNTLNEFNVIESIFNNFYQSIELDVQKAKIKGEELKEKLKRLREEIDNNLDANFYVKTSREIQKLEMKINETIKRKEILKNKENQMEDLIEELKEIQREIYSKRLNFVKEIQNKINFLRVKVEFKGNKNAFNGILEKYLKGSTIRKKKINKLAELFFDGYTIYKAVKNKEKKLVEVLGDNDFNRLRDKIINNSDFIVENAPDNIIIEYKLESGEYKPLERLSIGQRAAAILAIILLHQDKPIIIDQPEDDIDNSTIYKGIIKTILERKDENQFIFATHNSNIVVLGDTDNVIVCRNENEKLMLVNGSVDSENIQKEIISIMEGGKEAFNKRKIIYRLWG